MKPTPKLHFEVECLDCGHKESTFDPRTFECPHCGSGWQTARYDLDEIKLSMPAQLRDRAFDLWRYRELLPLSDGPPSFSMGEGGTPLFHAQNLGMMIGLSNLYIKDERQGPTASFKDRQAAMTIAALKEIGVTEAVVASTGNVAISNSAYCARAGIKLWAFLTSLVPPAKMHEIALYGTQVVKLTSTYDQAKAIAGEFAAERGLFIDRGGRSIPAIESMKTVAFEIAEQLGGLLPEDQSSGEQIRWRSPDWYVQAVSGGLGPMGVIKGFEELEAMGFVDKRPAIACLQARGCSPMVDAWKKGSPTSSTVDNPTTYISTLTTGDPGRVYEFLYQYIENGPGGAMESVTDAEAFRAMHLLAKMEGLSVEPATAVAFAGLLKLVEDGTIAPDEYVVVNCTGHTMPIEEELLGEDWARDVIRAEGVLHESPHEGLLSALRIDHRRVHEILIVDDNSDARRLVRRILQAQGRFDVLEAESGTEALELASANPPDLVILDLMMPEMDGFTVLDRLKGNPRTEKIPIVVITAKELSANEKKLLAEQTSRLMSKGDFLSDDLIEEIDKVIS